MVDADSLARCVREALEKRGFRVVGMDIDKYYTEASETVRIVIKTDRGRLVYKLKGYILKTLMVMRMGRAVVSVSTSRDLDELTMDELYGMVDKLVERLVNKL